ncbi:hypothetical protein DFS33DRAFT_1386750 [Desarmillaria ectypa]|nr:hypothetical protein DFS33DRAFT_1386750 [Desarmillaria ectypa]
MSDEDASVISVDTSGEHDMEDNPALKPQLTHFYPLSSEKGSKYSLHTVPEVVPQNEDGGTGAKPFQSPAFKKKTKRNRGFGARRAGEQKSERAAFDYEDKYPEDPIYEETAPTARVWRTYLDKSQRFDADIVSDWRDTVDILLVFAGLFSAVVSAFAVQFSQNLQPDYNQISAYLLFEFISIQQAVSNGNSLDLPLSSMDRRANFNPATSCMGERAVVHQSRTESFSGSRICFGEAMAPPLYEASICTDTWVCASGLVVFLGPMHTIIAWITGGIGAIAYLVVIATNVLPFWFSQCPYRTPLADAMYVSASYFSQHVVPKLKGSLLNFYPECRPV